MTWSSESLPPAQKRWTVHTYRWNIAATSLATSLELPLVALRWYFFSTVRETLDFLTSSEASFCLTLSAGGSIFKSKKWFVYPAGNKVGYKKVTKRHDMEITWLENHIPAGPLPPYLSGFDLLNQLLLGSSQNLLKKGHYKV
jgi:hypothetical protein